MKRISPKKALLYCIVSVCGLWAIYLVAANFLLSSGTLESVISRRPERTHLTWERAWTFFPGRIQVEGFSLTGQTPKWQYGIFIDRGSLKVGLFSLARRHFIAKDIDAEDLTVHLRRQRLADQPPRPDQAFEAPLPELPALRPDLHLLLPISSDRKGWRISLDHIAVASVDEFWWGPYRMRGSGTLLGAIDLEIRGPLAVRDSQLEWRAVQTTVGDRIAAKELDVNVALQIDPVSLREDPGRAILAFVRGEFALRGEVADFGFLNVYLDHLPDARLSGAGDLDLEARIDRGAILDGARFVFRSSDLAFQMGEIVIRGRGTVDSTTGNSAAAAKQPATTSEMLVALDEIELEVAGESEPLVGPGLKVRARADVSDIVAGFRNPVVDIDLPESTIPDLAGLGRALPTSLPLFVDEASTATLRINARLSETSASGEVEIKGRGLRARLRETPMRADIDILGRIGAGSSFRDGLVLPSLEMRIDNLEARGSDGRKIDGWWARARLEDAKVDLTLPLRIEGKLHASLRDPSPMTTALVPVGKHRYLVGLFNTDGLDASADFILEEQSLLFENLRLRGLGLGRTFLGGSGFDVEAQAPLLDLEHGLQDFELKLRLDDMHLPGLAGFNALLPEGAKMRFLPGGTGRVGGSFRLAQGRADGKATLDATDVKIELADTLVSADLRVDFKLNELDLETGTIDVAGTRVRVSDLGFLDRGEVPDGWWVEAVFEQARAALTRPFSIDGRIRCSMRDTRPLVGAMAPKARSGLNLEDLLDISNVEASARIHLDDEALIFSDISVSGTGDAAGRLEKPGFEISGTMDRADLTDGLSGLALRVDLPRSRISDLRLLNDYLPSATGLSFGAEGDAYLEASLDLRDSLLWGEVRLDASQLDMRLGKTRALGRLRVDLSLREGDLNSQIYALDDGKIRIENVLFSDFDSTDSAPWYANLAIGESTVFFGKPMRVRSRMDFEVSATKPLAKAFVDDKEQGWLLNLLDFQDVRASAIVAMDGQTIEFDRLSLSGRSAASSNLFGAELTLSAGGSKIKLGERFDDLRVRVDLPRTALGDLSVLERFVPATETMRLVPGTGGWVEGFFLLDGNRAIGEFLLDAPGARFTSEGAEIVSDLSLTGRITSEDLTKPVFALERLDVDFTALSFEDEDVAIDSWWGGIRLDRGELRLTSPLSLDAQVNLSFRDSDPLARLFTRNSWLLRRIRRWLSVDHITGSTRMTLGNGELSFRDLHLSGDNIDVIGRLQFSDAGPRGFIFTKFHKIPLAFGLERERRRVKFFRPRRWYEKKIADSPVD